MISEKLAVVAAICKTAHGNNNVEAQTLQLNATA